MSKEKKEPKQASPQVKAAWWVISTVADMRAPHSLMPAPLLNQVFSATIWLVMGSVIFTMVRSFQPATPNFMAENVLSVLMAYAVLFVAGLVALRRGTHALIYEDWAKFSALTFGLLLATAFLYAVAYGIFYAATGLTPVDCFRNTNEYVVRFSVAFICSVLVTGCLSARTRLIERAVWSQVTHKKFWISFYTILVAAAITLVASY